MFGRSALELWEEETLQRPIITLCKKLDDAIGGGIAMGLLTEFCGPPGSGKTQFCFQLCVNVQIPQSVGGIGGRAIFIDTNQDFWPYRVQEIATACSKRYDEVFKSGPSSSAEFDFSVEKILSNITYFYCGEHTDLQAVVTDLSNTLKSDDNLKLIAIDSICQPFRTMQNYAERTQLLFQLLTDLQILADKHSLAVVLTNDLTTRFDENNEVYLMAALGDSHGHKIGQRIMLGRKPNSPGHYIANLVKTKLAPPDNIGFKITDGGIRGSD